MLRAFVAVERDLDRAAPLEVLAAHACLSAFHFHRIFTSLVGEGPAEYLRRLRLERAAHELATTGDNVREIGRRAGYARPESFTRAFRDRFGQLPSVFRAERTKLWAPRPQPTETFDGRIQAVPPLRVAFIRHVGPYQQVAPQFERLRHWADQPALSPGVPPRYPLFLGIAHDDPGVTPAPRLWFDCCIEVEQSAKPQGDIGIQAILGATFAVGLHRGPFTTLAETYTRLAREYLPSQDAVLLKGPAIEIYLTPPQRMTAEPGLTEILLPVSVKRNR